MDSLPNISFSQNWNQKLFNNCLSTIRVYNAPKHVEGDMFHLSLRTNKRNIILGLYELVKIRKFKLIDLTEEMAYLDTGYSKSETTTLIKKMYSNKDIDIWNVVWVHLIFKRKF